MTEKHYLPMDGVKVEITYEETDIFKLEFDPENPRISSILKRHSDKISEKFIDEQLWDRNSTHKLYKDIEMAGGLLERVLVYKNKVIEGNTRLCCYRHLYENAPAKEKDKWKHIPCSIIQGNISRKQVHMLLCNFHVVRKTEWDTYEKGNYLTNMVENDKLDLEYVAKITHLTEKEIKDHIKAFRLMVEEKDNNIKRYSYYLEIIKNPKINALKKEDSEIQNKIVTAIKNNCFNDAKDIRKIPAIFEDKRARKKLFEYCESADQVYHELKAKSPMIGSSFLNAVKELTRRLQKLKREERDALKENKSQKKHIKVLTKELLNLAKEIGAN